MKLKNMKRIIALGLAVLMAAAVVPASSVSAKTKYKTVKEDGKEYIVFGSYEQDGNSKNGKEPIEWEVLGEDDKGILVVSRYILDCQPYNKKSTEVFWETCTLRKWLNKKFYKTAFNAKEQKKINTVKVENTGDRYGDTFFDRNTNDKLFCLSVDEILNYYTFNIYYDENHPGNFDLYNHGYCQDLITPATQYAKKKGVDTCDITNETYKDEYKGYGYSKDCINRDGGFWWLRSHGFFIDHACDVNYNGGTGETFFNLDVASVAVGVRPAMYLKK